MSNGARIGYEVAGSGPPLVLLHGFFGDRSSWDSAGYIGALAGQYQLIPIDLVGHGESDVSRDPARYRSEAHCRDVIAVLDDLGLDQAAVWGASMGGRVGLRLLAEFPSQVRALIAGGAHIEPVPVDPAGAEREAAALREQGTAPFAATMEPDWFRQAALRLDGHAAAAQVLAAAATVGQPVPLAADSAGIPVLLLAGDADPRLEQIRQTARRLPRAEVAVLPNCDHFGSFARRELTLPLVTAFLAAHAR